MLTAVSVMLYYSHRIQYAELLPPSTTLNCLLFDMLKLDYLIALDGCDMIK
jgi:hypothetical protein